MAQIRLHEDVRRFKQFIIDKPRLKEEVRSGEFTWQELFDRWKELGETDPFWDQFVEETGSDSKKEKKDLGGTFQTILNAVSSIDVDKLEKQVHSLSKTIDQVQKLMNDYRSSSSNQQPPQRRGPFF